MTPELRAKRDAAIARILQEPPIETPDDLLLRVNFIIAEERRAALTEAAEICKCEYENYGNLATAARRAILYVRDKEPTK